MKNDFCVVLYFLNNEELVVFCFSYFLCLGALVLSDG